MSRIGASPLAFPEFRGATRRLILWNLATYFALALAQLVAPFAASRLALAFSFAPNAFLHGALWQPITYSFVHVGLLGTLLELLSLWFLAGFLENYHKSAWVISLYAVSVLGTATAAVILYVCSQAMGFGAVAMPLYGCFGGIFGLLVAIGALYGDMEFVLFPLPMSIKARYLVAVYALVTVAMLFGQQRMYAWSAAHVRLCAVGRRAGRPALHPASPAPRLLHRAQRTMVRRPQPLLPLEASPRRPQVRGLYALPGPHRPLRRQRPPHRRRLQRQKPLELKVCVRSQFAIPIEFSKSLNLQHIKRQPASDRWGGGGVCLGTSRQECCLLF